MDHDGSYHLLFSHPELVEDLVKHFIPERWVQDLDFKSLQRVNAKLHTEGLERRDGDIIYRINLHSGGEMYLYLLLEFQSKPDKWMALRVLVYVSLLYQHLARENQLTSTGKLPPVFPLVLYNGDARWTAPATLEELIALPKGSDLWRWQPNMGYYLLEESQHAGGEVESPVGFLFQMESARDLRKLRELIGELDQSLPEDNPSLTRAFLSWLEQVRLPGIGLGGLKVKELSEVKNMLTTRIEQWEAELLEKGKAEGKAEGIHEGEAALLRQQLQRRFGALPNWAEQKLTEASCEDLEQWGLKLLEAANLEEVFR
jgi:hypothetical protein